MRSIDRALALAKRRGMTQADFARAMKIERQDITNWKARGMPAAWVDRAAEALSCSTDYLFSRGPPPEIDSSGRTPQEVLGQQLLGLFWRLSEAHRDDIMAMANKWANEDDPGPPSARNPFPSKVKAR